MFTLDNYASKFVEKETIKKHYFVDNGMLSIFLDDAITYDQEEQIELEGLTISVVPAWKWLMRF